jgi:hypothetical protein
VARLSFVVISRVWTVFDIPILSYFLPISSPFPLVIDMTLPRGFTPLNVLYFHLGRPAAFLHSSDCDCNSHLFTVGHRICPLWSYVHQVDR